ncbi:MAG: ECF transporter S component [Oscillospiraceae bacterium]|nr:ECF transporter S component [Oscillospiraceae bacterium]
MQTKTKRMATNAMLAALYFALSMLAVPVGGLKLTFEHLPVIVAALMFGPVDAMIVGALGELANQMLTYGFTVTTLLWMTPAMFRGLSMGLCAKLLRGYVGLNAVIEKKLPIAFWVTCVISGLICSLLNTFTLYVDSKMFGYYTYAMVFGVLWVRLAASAVSSVLMAAAAKPVLAAMRKAKIV